MRLSFAAAVIAMVGAWAAGAASPARADTYPSKPVRIVVPSAPGGGMDVTARLLGDKLAPRLGQPVLIDNKPGAGLALGTGLVAKAAPDGYTLLLSNPGPLALRPNLYPDLPYDALRDFEAISGVASSPIFLVVPATSTVTTLQQLIELGKSPQKGAFGSAGVGSQSHIAGEWLNSVTGTSFTHVPYNGASPQITDTVAGRVQMAFLAAVDALPQIRQGSVRALATTTGVRSPLAPEIPTFQEAGLPELNIETWYALLTPAKTPREVVDRLRREVVDILAQEDIKARYLDISMLVTPTSPEAVMAQFKTDKEKYGSIIKGAGIKPE